MKLSFNILVYQRYALQFLPVLRPALGCESKFQSSCDAQGVSNADPRVCLVVDPGKPGSLGLQYS